MADNQVTSDVRSHFMRLLKAASVTSTMVFLYPRMIAIHDLKDEAGFPGPNGRLIVPSFMRLAHEYMVSDGAYLISTCDSQLR
jgi:protein transport protein SEC24